MSKKYVRPASRVLAAIDNVAGCVRSKVALAHRQRPLAMAGSENVEGVELRLVVMLAGMQS
jgi:hypothetical protein